MCKNIRVVLLTFILSILASIPALAATQIYECDVHGNNRVGPRTNFTINLSNLTDIASDYVYYGVEVGSFRRNSDTEGVLVDIVDYIADDSGSSTDDLNLTVNFSDLSGYSNGSVYMIGYRVLYKLVDNGEIIEGDWKLPALAQRKYFTAESTLNPANILKYTDMVTAANMRYINDPAKAAIYNKYMPGSEVVEKFVLDPNGGSVSKYNVQLDLAGGSTAANNIIVKYIKIARITDISDVKANIVNKVTCNGNIKSLGSNLVTYSSSTPYSSKSVSFDIDVPPANGDHKIVVYLKYYFKKSNNITLSSKTYADRVTITADGGDPVKTPALTIYVRDVKIKLR